MKRLALLFCCLSFMALPGIGAGAQTSAFNPDSLCLRYNLYSRLFCPEKLYLHLDRAAFVPGETIWFTGYLCNASPTASQAVSNYIYVELQDKNGGTLQVVKVRRAKDNTFPGYMNIPDNILTGFFTIRAYTQWQLNDDPEFFFHQTISISSKTAKAEDPQKEIGGGKEAGDAAVEIILRRREDYCYVGVMPKDNQAVGGRVELFLRSSAKMVHLSTMTLSSAVAWVRIATPSLPQGLDSFLAYDSSGKLLAERLFYVYDRNPVHCEVQSTLRGPSTARARELARNVVTVVDSEGKPLSGNFSVSVVKGSIAAQKQGLLSYMELSSEMAEPFDEPDRYFDGTLPVTVANTLLDKELSGRRWGYYRMKDILSGKFIVQKFKEYAQSISGSIEKSLSRKMPRNFTFSLFIPALKATKFVRVDKADTFSIDSLDFPENTTFLISVSKEGTTQYIPKWSGDSFAPRYKYMTDLKLREVKAETFVYQQSADTLEAAVVTGDVMPSYRILNTDIPALELEAYKTKTLIQYLQIRYPYFRYVDGMMISTKLMQGTTFLGTADNPQDEDRRTVAAAEAANMLGDAAQSMRVKLVINDNEEEWWIYEDVYLENIAAISVTHEPDARFNAPGGIVEIKIKPGLNLSKEDRMARNLLVFVPLGYQRPDYFYSPRYDRGAPDDGFDHRNTIFWSPSVSFRDGRAEFLFCDTDQLQHPYEVRIEGVTSDGKPFSCHKFIGEE